MKLKSKLIITFCIIMFVPIVLALFIIWAFFRVQWEVVAQNIEVMPDVRGLFFDILLIIKNYAALIVVLIVSFEAMVKRGFIVKLAFVILLAIIVLFQFFPGTWQNITELF